MIVESNGAPTESPAGGSGRNEEAPAPTKNEEGRRKNAYDLNELPPNDDDDEIEEKVDL
ncbi:hypothetical protein TSUD_155080 [Trifolium subterraneum]|uniref:Uncharacterized protein n=1 Tax=Trifolium subterraneum TaxID=3900 RepID=A0A2Z6LYG1_TRISU|nr:hypothetical protein TSUD_155080 [Trifolium subterraneum]